MKYLKNLRELNKLCQINLFLVFFSLLSFKSFSQSSSATIIADEVSADFSRKFKLASARYYSEAPIVYINPLHGLILLDTPLMTSTQLFILPGTSGQEITVYGYNIAGKLQISNADAKFHLGNRDIWKAFYFNNKWIEYFRSDN